MMLGGGLGQCQQRRPWRRRESPTSTLRCAQQSGSAQQPGGEKTPGGRNGTAEGAGGERSGAAKGRQARRVDYFEGEGAWGLGARLGSPKLTSPVCLPLQRR